MSNHLLIGLGGTGGKILRAMRKRIYEEFSTNNPKTPTHVEFLYVDSDSVDLNDDKSWVYNGHPVHLSPNQKVNIHGIGGGVLKNLDAYPGIKAFITPQDRELLKSDQVTGIIDTGIGGQRRRFGRILMANNVVNDPLNGFSATLKQRIINLQHANQGDGRISFHIIAGLAGGTGSGSIVDTIAQLHKIVEPMGQDFEVFLYLYVPEILVPAKHNSGFYHANGYAALQEINAISLGKYYPTDITGEIDHKTGKVKRLATGGNMKPFKMAYLFSDRNEDSHVIEKSTKLPLAVADFIFQKTFGQETGPDAQMHKLVDLENYPAPPEKNDDGDQIHDSKFITFGIVRIAYPESEIRTYAIEKCNESVLRGLIYNLWGDRSGFMVESDEKAGVGINIEVRRPGYQEAMLLSPEYLTLQHPVADFPGSQDFNTFKEYWTNISTFFSNDIVESENNYRLWAGKLDEILDQEYNSNFREIGVPRYFANNRQQKEVNRYAAIICGHIEKTLFNEWVNGIHGENQPMSLQKVYLYLKELENATIERIPKIAETKAVYGRERDNAAAIAAQERARLVDTGRLGELLFGSAKRHFLRYTAAKTDEMVYNTSLEALDFSYLLLQAIVTRLNEMKSSVQLLRNMISDGIDISSSETQGLSIHPAQNNNEVEILIKRFDAQTVEDSVNEGLISDEDLQATLKHDTLQRFKEIATATGKSALFSSLYDAFGGRFSRSTGNEGEKDNTNVLLDIVSNTNDATIVGKLDQMAEEENTRSILGVNILEKLKTDFPTDAQLEAFVRENITRCVRPFLQFNNEEKGIGHVDMIQGMQIVLPKYADSTNFRDSLKKVFRGQFGDNLIDDMSFSDQPDNKNNEITVIITYSGFPLRFIQNLKYLKEQYDNIVSVHNPHTELNRMLLHTESLNRLPGLFNEDPAEQQGRVKLLAVQIHSIPNILSKGVDPDTTEEVNVITVGSGFNAVDFILGKDAVQTTRMLTEDRQLRRTLSEYINELIKERYRTTADKKQFMKEIEDMVCADVLKACGGNRLSPEFKSYVKVATEYFETLQN